jgi:ketosteroid isomerase-like protein
LGQDNNRSFDSAVEEYHKAIIKFVNGDPNQLKEISSHTDDITLFGGFGGYARGWDSVERRYIWASSRYKTGEVRFGTIARFATNELGCCIELEHQKATLEYSGEIVPRLLRATSIFRKEGDGQWKLVHRHAEEGSVKK